MANHASVLGLDKDLLLKLRPVSKKIKVVTLEVNLQSVFIKEGKATLVIGMHNGFCYSKSTVE